MGLFFFAIDTTTNTSVLEEFDHVFFFGDTNYRINADRPWVLERIKSEDYKVFKTCKKKHETQQLIKAYITSFAKPPTRIVSTRV